MPEVWPYLNQTLFHIIDVAFKFALLTHPTGFSSGLLGGQRSGVGDMNSGVSDADIRRCHMHDEPARCTAGSALAAMVTVAAGTPLY